MTGQETSWLPGIIVLLVGVGLAIFFVLLARRSRAFGQVVDRDDKLLDLDRRIQNALDALREHAAEVNRLPKEQFEAQKAELELAAARAMKARDDYQKAGGKKAAKSAAAAEGKAAGQAAQTPALGFFASRPGLRGALWGGGVVGFFMLLGILITQEQKPREEGMEATGKVPSAGQTEERSPQEQEEERQFKAAMERIRQNAEDVDALAQAAHALLRREQFQEADSLTERGVGIDPFHVETRVHRAMLKGAKGDLQGALSELERLANTYPAAYEALLFAGAMSMELGDKKRALGHFERYLNEAPAADQPPQIRMGIAALRAEVGG